MTGNIAQEANGLATADPPVKTGLPVVVKDPRHRLVQRRAALRTAAEASAARAASLQSDCRVMEEQIGSMLSAFGAQLDESRADVHAQRKALAAAHNGLAATIRQAKRRARRIGWSLRTRRLRERGAWLLAAAAIAVLIAGAVVYGPTLVETWGSALFEAGRGG